MKNVNFTEFMLVYNLLYLHFGCNVMIKRTSSTFVFVCKLKYIKIMIMMIVASFMKFIWMMCSKSDIERREYSHIAMCQHGDRFECLWIPAKKFQLIKNTFRMENHFLIYSRHSIENAKGIKFVQQKLVYFNFKILWFENHICVKQFYYDLLFGNGFWNGK